MGVLGGYVWSATADYDCITVNIFLFASASRDIGLPNGETARITMVTTMPWQGQVSVTVSAPIGWTWEINFPMPNYAEDIKVRSSSMIVRA